MLEVFRLAFQNGADFIETPTFFTYHELPSLIALHPLGPQIEIRPLSYEEEILKEGK
jgi:hypothetical protein